MKKYGFVMIFLLAVGLVAAACGGEDAAPQMKQTATTGAMGNAAIAGVISYTNGDTDSKIAMDADPVCVGLHKDGAVETQSIVGAEGKLSNVFVYIKSGLSGSYSPSGEEAVLDQKGCMYSPHVSGVQVGQKLVIRNSDPTLHNVHALPTVNAEFNKGQPFQNMTFDHKFDKPEVMIRFKCDVHPWMSSYMGVVSHPFFAVSGADGSYSIDRVPAGTYTVEAWHETLGTKTMEITVGDDAVAAASFDFSPASS